MFSKQETKVVDGVVLQAHNEVDNRGRWHLSYNPRTDGYGCVTTALVFDNNVFFVLCGDHRKAWGEAADLDHALEYFMAHKKQVHKASEHLMALGWAKDEFNLMPTLADIAGPAMFTKLFNAFKAGADDESD